MTGQEITEKVKQLGLPQYSYVVFGSCPMALAGIREANDIDLLVSKDLLEQLREAGWKVFEKSPHDKPLVYGDFEAHAAWDFSDYQPTLKQLLKTATYVDDIPFAAINEVRTWKLSSGRPKDLTDIKLIDAYLASHA